MDYKTNEYWNISLQEYTMKKAASVFGISILSLAVSLAPAFAQMQPKPHEPSAAAPTVQPKPADKPQTPVPMTKDDKNTPVKPESKTNTKAALPAAGSAKSENAPVKAADTKAPATVTPGAATTAKDKPMPAKTGTADVSANTTSKPVDAKNSQPSVKSEGSLKEEKSVSHSGKAAKSSKAGEKSLKSEKKVSGKDVQHVKTGKTSTDTAASKVLKNEKSKSSDPAKADPAVKTTKPATNN